MSLEVLKKNRAVLRKSVTLLVEKFYPSSGEVGPAAPREVSRDVDDIEANVQLLESKKNALEALNTQIFQLMVESDSKEEELEAETARVDEYVLKLNKTLSGLKRRVTQIQPARDVGSLSAGSTGNRSFAGAVRLPKLTLPTFDGSDVTQWTTFHDQFHSAVHSNGSLSEVDKFSYLLGILRGEAKNCIANLPLTESNYHLARELLEQRYGSKDIIVQQYMKKLEAVRCFSDSPSCLRAFVDTINSSTRALETLGIETSSYEVFLLPSLEAKLPPATRTQVIRAAMQQGSSSSKPDRSRSLSLFTFLEALDAEVCILERCSSETKHVKSKPVKSSFDEMDPLQTDRGGHGSVLAASSKPMPQGQSFQKGNAIFCTFCNERHASEKCTRFPDSNSPVDILKQQKRCFCCLRPNHSSDRCNSAKTCRGCGRFHNPSICRTLFPGKVKPQPVTSGEARSQQSKLKGTTAIVSSSEVNQVEPEDLVAMQCLLVNSNPPVAMPTAKCFIFHQDGEREMKRDDRAFLNSFLVRSGFYVSVYLNVPEYAFPKM